MLTKIYHHILIFETKSRLEQRQMYEHSYMQTRSKSESHMVLLEKTFAFIQPGPTHDFLAWLDE